MAIKKRKHPKFLRPNYGRTSRSRIRLAWRSQRGIDNKKKSKIKYMGSSPSIGYRQPNAIRHFHPRGMPEALVQSPSEIAGLKAVLIRIAGGVGARKSGIIAKLAKEAGLHVLNPHRERKREKEKREKKAAKAIKREEKAAAEKRAAEGKKEEERKAAEKKEADRKAAEAKKEEERKAAEAKKEEERKAAEQKAASAKEEGKAAPGAQAQGKAQQDQK